MNQHSETKPCLDCGTALSTEPISLDWFGKIKTYPSPNICDDCSKRRDEERKAQEKAEALEKEWRKIAPPLYRNNDTTRFPQQLQDALETFDPDSDMGIGIRGKSGQCKTRAAYEILKIAHAGTFHFNATLPPSASMFRHRVAATRGTEIAHPSRNQWDDRPHDDGSSLTEPMTIGQFNQKTLQHFARCRWFLIDDLGKEKPTDTSESALYDILEQRTSNNLPTIWTLNMTAKELKRRHSTDRSTPILRRLVEFSDVITLD